MKNAIIVLVEDSPVQYNESGFENDFQSSIQHLALGPVMIVCLCKGVSCRTIDAELARGAKTVGGVAKACQAGTGCGMCVGQIRDLIRLRTGDTDPVASTDTPR